MFIYNIIRPIHSLSDPESLCGCNLFSLFKKAYKSCSYFAKFVMAICTNFYRNVVNMSALIGMSIGILTPAIVTLLIAMRFDIPIHYKNTHKSWSNNEKERTKTTAVLCPFSRLFNVLHLTRELVSHLTVFLFVYIWADFIIVYFS